MKKDVFLSYNHANSEPAFKIANSLNEMGLRVWLDSQEIKLGESWQDAIEKGINESSCVIALVSSANDKNSDFYQTELQTALSRGKTIFPVIMGDASTDDLPDALKDKQAIRIFDNANSYAQLMKLYEAIDSKRGWWSKAREYLVNS